MVSKKHINNLVVKSIVVVMVVESILIVNHIFKRFIIDDFKIEVKNRFRDVIHLDEFLNLGSNRKYVYLDLGTNNGDSVIDFFRDDRDKVYPSLIPSAYANMVAWEVYAFEPNAAFDASLFKMKSLIEEQRVAQRHTTTVHVFNRTAVWTYDGFVDFYLDTRHLYEGSSVKVDHPDVDNGRRHVNVSCLDAARVLRQFNKNDFVVVKMDVEGAEYDLLVHLVLNNVLGLIDVMAVEYHKKLSYFQTPEQVFNYIIKASGVKLFKWL